MNNIFLKQRVPEPIADLFSATNGWTTTTPLTLTSTDPAYFHYAVLTGILPSQPQYVSQFEDIPNIEMISLSLPASSTPAIDRELTFLNTLGLLTMRDNNHYISPLAEALYGPAGPFQTGTPTKQTAGLFLHYIIPGYRWRAFVYRTAAAESSGIVQQMDGVLRQLQSLSAQLEAIVNMTEPMSRPPSRVETIAKQVGTSIVDALKTPRI